MSRKKPILRFFKKRQPRQEEQKAQDADPLLPVVMQLLCQTEDKELSCDEVLEIIDEYAELKAKGENVEKLYPLIRVHIDRCRDCLEEYEALIRVLDSH